MKTPKNYDIKEIGVGQYYHFGLREKLRYFSKQNSFLDNFGSIELTVGVDGLPINQSNKKQFWPILVSCPLFNRNKPFMVLGMQSKPEKVE